MKNIIKILCIFIFFTIFIIVLHYKLGIKETNRDTPTNTVVEEKILEASEMKKMK